MIQNGTSAFIYINMCMYVCIHTWLNTFLYFINIYMYILFYHRSFIFANLRLALKSLMNQIIGFGQNHKNPTIISEKKKFQCRLGTVI